MNEKALFSLFKVNSEKHSLAEIPARRRALDQDGLGTVDDPFAGCLCYNFSLPSTRSSFDSIVQLLWHRHCLLELSVCFFIIYSKFMQKTFT